MIYPQIALKDCCEVIGGATPKRNVPEYWGNDIPWVTPKDVSNITEPVLDDAPEYISQVGYDSCATYLLPKGAILLTSRAPIGNVAIVGREMCTNQGFKSLIPGKDVDSLYLYYCIKNNTAKLQNLGNGATFKEVSKKIVESFEIPLPPLKEQRRIAAILDKADAIRRKRQRAIELTETFLRSVFLNMFGDPMTNPKGWEIKPLIDLVDSERPITYGILKPGPDHVDGVPYIRVVDMASGGVLHNQVKRTSSEIAEQYKRSKLITGDLLLSIRGHVGRMSINPPILEGANITQDTARLAIKDTALSNYVFHCLQTEGIQRWMIRHTKGGAVKGINLGDVKEIPISIPEKTLRAKYSEIVGRHSIKLTKQREALEKSMDLFSSLTQIAFKGELTQSITHFEEAISA